MSRRTTLTMSTLLCLAVSLLANQAVGQEKQQVSFKSTAENTKYPQQMTIEIGDVPGHNYRVFEIHITFPDNAPVINGLKLVEEWRRGISDLTGGSGIATLHHTYVMENGDRFYARLDNVNRRTPVGLSTTAVGPITGGTGKFSEIRGIAQMSAIIKPGQQIDSQTDIEYLIGK